MKNQSVIPFNQTLIEGVISRNHSRSVDFNLHNDYVPVNNLRYIKRIADEKRLSLSQRAALTGTAPKNSAMHRFLTHDPMAIMIWKDLSPEQILKIAETINLVVPKNKHSESDIPGFIAHISQKQTSPQTVTPELFQAYHKRSQAKITTELTSRPVISEIKSVFSRSEPSAVFKKSFLKRILSAVTSCVDEILKEESPGCSSPPDPVRFFI